MKMCKLMAVLLCSMTLTFGLTACTAESTEAPVETAEIPEEPTEAPEETAEVPEETMEAPAETTADSAETEEADEVEASFASRLDYVAEKDENIECVVIIEALEGSFKEDVKPEEITFGEGVAEASEVEILSNDDKTLEVGFVIPKGDLDVDNFSVTASVLLADGVFLDTEGNSVGEMGELSTYEMHTTDRASSGELIYPPGTVKLKHSGAYVAKFYVYWDVVQWDKATLDMDGTLHLEADSKETGVKRESWSGNGKNKTAGYEETIRLAGNVRNITIIAQGKTGLVWQPWTTSVNVEGLSLVKTRTLTISGTTLNQKARLDPEP